MRHRSIPTTVLVFPFPIYNFNLFPTHTHTPSSLSCLTIFFPLHYFPSCFSCSFVKYYVRPRFFGFLFSSVVVVFRPPKTLKTENLRHSRLSVSFILFFLFFVSHFQVHHHNTSFLIIIIIVIIITAYLPSSLEFLI